MYDLVGHFLIFGLVSVVGLLLPLLLGKLIRPSLPNDQKLSVYECGEPTIGSSFVQFDIRFYVVALLFIIFDVEVVFFFPWVLVFGGGTQLADSRLTMAERMNLSERLLSLPSGTLNAGTAISPEAALRFSWASMADVVIFFAVLLIGFAYVWKRGDLDWVRATIGQKIRWSQDSTPQAGTRAGITI